MSLLRGNRKNCDTRKSCRLRVSATAFPSHIRTTGGLTFDELGSQDHLSDASTDSFRAVLSQGAAIEGLCTNSRAQLPVNGVGVCRASPFERPQQRGHCCRWLRRTVRQQWVAKSRSPWQGGFVLSLVWPIAVEWPLSKVQRSVASLDDEWQVPAGAVIGPRKLIGCNQSEAGTRFLLHRVAAGGKR